MDKILKVLQNFQIKYPNSQIGGSVGLFLLGYDLKRDLSKSDLDILCDNYKVERKETKTFNEAKLCQQMIDDICLQSKSTSYSDFIDKYYEDDIKVEISKIIEAPAVEVIYNEFLYKVSPLATILKYKMKYALKGYEKHFNDIIQLINNGH